MNKSSSGFPGELIGSGRGASVYAHNGRALKLYDSPEAGSLVFREAAILSEVARHGLRVPRVHMAGLTNGRWGLLIDRIEGDSLADQILGGTVPATGGMAAMVQLQDEMHAIRPRALVPLKYKLKANITHASALAEPARSQLLTRLDALPEGDSLCHGDFHPYNLIGPVDRLTIIDWLDGSVGAPAADMCRSYLLLDLVQPELAEAYLQACAAQVDIDRETVLAWLPVIAGARLAENVDAEERDRLLALASGT